MAVYAYIRVSTDKQDAKNQTYTVSSYLTEKGLGAAQFIEETVSGKKSWKHRRLADVIEKLEAGDKMIVTEMSRLGRSMLEVFEIFSICISKDVEVHIVKNDHVLRNDINSKVLTFAFSLASELERELISSRTKEALARRKAEGQKLGRPKGSQSSKLDSKIEEIRTLHSKGVNTTSIAKIFDVSQTAMRHFIKSRRL
ncbi:MAG: resolvase [Denitrovibrio sp.]|nr:MAG: resolvase [Denitrovibrio sp.]